MDIEELVSRLKDRKVVVQPPSRMALRARRKRQEARVRKRSRGSSLKAKARRRRKRKEWKAGFSGQYSNFRKTMRNRDQDYVRQGKKPVGFELSPAEWKLLWTAAGTITVQGGIEMLAWRARGRERGAVKMKRIDRNKPWRLDNVAILWGDVPLVDGRKLANVCKQ